jgi:hypothetical protein
MYAGCGRAGDFAGDPLQFLASQGLVWANVAQSQIRANWTGVAGIPAGAEWYTYRNGVVIERGSTSPKTFDAVTVGVIPNLAAVPVAAGVGDSSYDPLGGLNVANITSASLRVTYSHNLRGRYRIADNAMERYELYLGTDAEPDLAGTPFETFTTLPHTTAALTAGHTYYLVLRKRNKHNLCSQNISSTVIVVAADGSESTPPGSPEFALEQAVAGAVRVQATYDYMPEDASLRGTTWAVWLTTDGSDPDPSGAATYTEAVVLADGRAKLDWTSGAQTHGATLKVIVRTRRIGTPDVDSVNAVVRSITADAQGPTAPDAHVFYGQSARAQ